MRIESGIHAGASYDYDFELGAMDDIVVPW